MSIKRKEIIEFIKKQKKFFDFSNHEIDNETLREICNIIKSNNIFNRFRY